MKQIQSVLIVDDDPTQVAILTSYFASLDVNVIQGETDPLSAMQRIESDPSAFDTIVSDIQMPGMDGIEFIRHLSESGFNGKLALISGVKQDLLQHAHRLAEMHKISVAGNVSKPLTRASLDRVFQSSDAVDVAEVEAPQRGNPVQVTKEQLETAISNGEILPYYQPKVKINTGKVAGAEALARWIRPDGQMISPEIFISVANENGMIEELTFQLFEQSLSDLQKFAAVDPDFKLGVNLAPEMVQDLTLPDRLHEMVLSFGLKPMNLDFEITENSILDVDLVTLEVLSRMRVFGYELAIDDFGTGSSNIQTLRDFPFSELKIDRSFIGNAINNSFSHQTVKAAIALAIEQNMSVVAEGVEDMDTWNMLKELKVDQVQGYIVSKAMPPEDFVRFLEENSNGVAFAIAS